MSLAEQTRDMVGEDITDTVEQFWHLPMVIGLMAFMAWTRMQSWQNFVRDGTVYLSGNDAWYHLRETTWATKHWPFTMGLDPWTGYPNGIVNGQFGTLYDQILATVALIIGLGSPTDTQIRMVLLFAPPIASALVGGLVYWVTRRMTGERFWGVVSLLVLTFFTGLFFSRGLAGSADHNIVEPIFMLLAVGTIIWSLRKTESEIPTFGTIRDNPREAIPGVLTGVAFALYIFTWPPGLLLVGIFGVFAIMDVSVRDIFGMVTEHLLAYASVAGFTTFILIVPLSDPLEFGITNIGLPHLTFTFGLGLGCIAVEGARRRGVPAVGTIVGGLVGASILSIFVVPKLFNIVTQNIPRIIGLGTGASTRTISEAQPMGARGSALGALASEYGVFAFLAMVSVGVLIYMWYHGRGSENLFVAIWWVFMLFAALTQIRFNYYLAPATAIVSVLALHFLVSRYGGLRSLSRGQFVMVGLCVLLLVGAMGTNPVAAGNRGGPGASVFWQDSNDWLQENSPDPGMGDPYDSYEKDFDYPDPSYGVMSWWDYGHWITVQAERVPVANPFQQHANEAAKWLLAQNETEAQSVVDSMDEDDRDVRYVMVDWQMIAPMSKFGAPTVFHENRSRSDFVEPSYQQRKKGRLQFATYQMKQDYYEAMMVRLYLGHGSRMGPGPFVVQSSQITRQGRELTILNEKPVKRFKSVQQARFYAQQNENAHLGGLGMSPRETVPALEHHRLVDVSSQSAVRSRYGRFLQGQARLGVPPQDLTQQPQWIKTFERVEGATLTGESSAPVMVSVQMRVPETNSTFVYRQRANLGPNGTWTATVPYSTKGYGSSSEYTNVSVRATGPYRVVSGNSSRIVHVSETAVNEGETLTID